MPAWAWNAISGFFEWGFLPSAVLTFPKYKKLQRFDWIKNRAESPNFKKYQHAVFALVVGGKAAWEAGQLLTGAIPENQLDFSIEQTLAAIPGAYCGTYGFRNFYQKLKRCYYRLRGEDYLPAEENGNSDS